MKQLDIDVSPPARFINLTFDEENIKIKLALSLDKKRKFNLDFGRD